MKLDIQKTMNAVTVTFSPDGKAKPIVVTLTLAQLESLLTLLRTAQHADRLTLSLELT